MDILAQIQIGVIGESVSSIGMSASWIKKMLTAWNAKNNELEKLVSIQWQQNA